MKHIYCLLILFILLLCPMLVSYAETASDITESCLLENGAKETTELHDFQYTTCWKSKKGSDAYLACTIPEEKNASYLYICFAELPDSWHIETKQGEGWIPYQTGSNEFLHVLIPMSGIRQFRIVDTSKKNAQLRINEIYLFSEGELPDWVQRWQPTHEKADLLLLVAHPDDEILFFGGTIPYYTAERNKRVIVAYMTGSNNARSSELLNGLWHMGMRNYPVIGSFFDDYSYKLSDAYEIWPKRYARAYVMELIRKYKPDVMLTHDIDGEYGHGAHKLCADVVQYCVERSANESVFPELAEKHGLWEIKKLYLHLYPENTIRMNWRIPLETMNGKTGLELATEAYAFHVTQQDAWFYVDDEGEYSCAEFGLVHSSVGSDIQKNDFFENIHSHAPN